MPVLVFVQPDGSRGAPSSDGQGLEPAGPAEAGLVEFAWEPRGNSRLACQIEVTAELDGLVLHVPAEQI